MYLYNCLSDSQTFKYYLFIYNKMSIPTSKILKASKAVMAIADLKNNSPNSNQSQNVNVYVSSAPVEKKVTYPDAEQHTPQNPYENMPEQSPTCITRDIESAMAKTEELSCNIDEKENVIKALALIIDIIQHNPLIVNKYVIAELETLAELIKLMTNSEAVEIDVDDIDCSCSKTKYRMIKRIYIKKDGEIYSMAQCPVILRLFDNYKISTTLAI